MNPITPGASSSKDHVSPHHDQTRSSSKKSRLPRSRSHPESHRTSSKSSSEKSGTTSRSTGDEPSLRNTHRTRNTPPGIKLDLKPATELALTSALSKNKDLGKILSAVANVGGTIKDLDRGRVNLYFAGLEVPINIKSTDNTKNQVRALSKVFDPNSKSEVMIGFCCGNRAHRASNALNRPLDGLKSIMGNRSRNDLSVHTVVNDADSNPKTIRKIFENNDIVNENLVNKDIKSRKDDAKSYMDQARKQGIPMDKLITSTASPNKASFSANFKNTARSIVNDIQVSSSFSDVREIIKDRVKPMQDLLIQNARGKRFVGEIRKNLVSNEHKLVEKLQSKYNSAEKKQAAALIVHSMDVLEQTLARTVKVPGLKAKDTEGISNAIKSRLAPSKPANEVTTSGLYKNIFKGVLDSKSTDYVGNQVYEFNKFSNQKDLVYIYTGSPDIFIDRSSKKNVHHLEAKPVPQKSGTPLASSGAGSSSAR